MRIGRFIIIGIIFAGMGIIIQGCGLITEPAYWASYGYVFGIISQSILVVIDETKGVKADGTKRGVE